MEIWKRRPHVLNVFVSAEPGSIGREIHKESERERELSAYGAWLYLFTFTLYNICGLVVENT